MELQQTTIYRPGDEDNFLRKKHIGTLSFVVGLLLFFLPFVSLKCGSVTLLQNTGVGIAMGSSWKLPVGNTDLLKNLGNQKTQVSEVKEYQAGLSIYLLVAIVTALFGIAISFSNLSWRKQAGMVAGLLCCALMLALMIHLSISLRQGLQSSATEKPDVAKYQGLIKIQFSIWFFLSVAAFAAAAFFNYKQARFDKEAEEAGREQFEFQREESV